MESEPIEALNKLLTRLDNLITFAEAKNAALLVFNTAILKGIDIDKINNSIGYKLIAIANMVSFFIALYSFKPLGNFKLETFLMFNIFKHQTQKNLDAYRLNLLYYEDIAKCRDFKQYEKFIAQRYKIDFKINEAFVIRDYAHEIFEDARIAARKYRLFKFAMRINLFMILMLAFILLI